MRTSKTVTYLILGTYSNKGSKAFAVALNSSHVLGIPKPLEDKTDAKFLDYHVH